MIITAQCTKGDKVCYSNPISIKIRPECAELFVKSTYVYNNKDRYIDIIATGCNGVMNWRHDGNARVLKKGNDYYNLKEVKEDVTVYGSCQGSDCPEAKITIPKPSEACNFKSLSMDYTGAPDGQVLIYSSGGSFTLSDGTLQYNTQLQKQVIVPGLNPNNLYTATFENGCPASILIPNQFDISLSVNNGLVKENSYDVSGIKNDGYYSLSMKPQISCPGKLVWSNDQDESFKVISSALTFRAGSYPPYDQYYPAVTTTYYATCFATDGTVYTAPNPKTLVVPSEQCIRIAGNRNLGKGDAISLTVTGCLDNNNIKWNKDGKPFGTGVKLDDIASATSTYTATCNSPICTVSQIVTVKGCGLVVKPGQSEIV
jgi:hypothetical protein